MIFTVTWDETALNQLANLWMQAPYQQAFSAAANQIDRILRVDADKKGQPLGKFRVLTVQPLKVLYHVSLDDCLVTVFQVRRV